MATFQKSLQFGLTGETTLAKWFMNHGYTILPVYPTVDEYKGPTVFSPGGKTWIAPDMLIFRRKDGGEVRWVEAKHKSAFTWHRMSERRFPHDEPWTTGIDLHHYQQYQRVQELSPWEIWLYFLHRPKGEAKDTPPGKVSPSGLFAGSLDYLRQHENHRHENHGKSGMVYWHWRTFPLHRPLKK